MADQKGTTKKSSRHPLGATPDAEGVNFSIFSYDAKGVELLLFDKPKDLEPTHVIPLDPAVNTTFFFWHIYVSGLRPGAHYAYRVDGPREDSQRKDGQSSLALGHRFNKNKVLIDPYAKGNTSALWDRVAACGPDDNVKTSMRSIVIDAASYDWEGDMPIHRPMRDTVIYELHVGSYTKSPTSGVTHPGTFSGLIEKIPYLKGLGITAVELMPVMDFDDKEVMRVSPADGKPLRNFWGYSTHSFFAPKCAYCVSYEEGSHLRDFRDMVKAFHRAGIEVILDVVFNHTSEGNQDGPTINFKGLDNRIYYHLVPSDKQYYMDYSGCGNTVNCNHPIAEKLIVECLEFWVRDMHVDGFRFDEGSILARDQSGELVPYPPVVWAIELSDVLADTKIIAEAWDAAGAYQVGYFPGYRWAEWNGRYRDDIRRFVKGDPGLVGAVASRIAGSADMYQCSGHLPINSINFVTCHDGFTLNDLVSYDSKHNEANGEANRDGADNNLSWNCGFEGPTNDQEVESLRRRQIKNFIAIMMVSQGVPMICGGDEVRRTQRGNNNPYCQDNEISWFDWSRAEKNHEMFRFCQRMIDFRKRNRALRRREFLQGEQGKPNDRGLIDIVWHGCRLSSPGWDDPNSRALGFTLAGFEQDSDIHVMMNMYWEPLDFELPTVSGRGWYRALDTALLAPSDIADPGAEVAISGNSYLVTARSVVVLVSK